MLFGLVERRRRDRINELIKMLAEIVPGCQKKDASNGNIVGVCAQCTGILLIVFYSHLIIIIIHVHVFTTHDHSLLYMYIRSP